MKVLNIHERGLEADPIQIGALIDLLASKEDRLWPKHVWPRMELDRSLGVGAKGGHGPIRYFVEEYIPGKSIKFHFTGPKGFDGFHGYEIVNGYKLPVVLRHTLKMNTCGPAIWSWPLVYRPMHDALMEDSLATAQVALGLPPKIQSWSLWVKILRWIVSGGKARSQNTPNNSFNTHVNPNRE
ncbi:MAG: SRPBCC family protein [Nitrospirae bacterium]|nr:SRPBCC family protein [Nitrospirota bacterium]MBI3351040.1 SRPBCC family protein [Nitrospirota bacterium]